MEITITFNKGEWTVNPDPAKVQVGESITWIVRSRSPGRRQLRWTIYFDHGIPAFLNAFVLIPGSTAPWIPATRLQMSTTTLDVGLGRLKESNQQLAEAIQAFVREEDGMVDHQGAMGPVTAEVPGEYKYGVKVEDPQSREILGDDDPKLIVLR